MRKIKDFIKVICWYIFKIFRIDKKKIVIDCFNGKSYSDNPKLIADAIYKLDPSYKIIVLIYYQKFDSIVLPSYATKVKYNSIRAIYELVTAKLWLGNSRKCYFTSKRKGQIYIQTWHGGIGAKKVEKDVQNTLSKEYVKYAKKDALITDYMIASGTWQKEVFKKSFWYDGKFIEMGWPTYDMFYNYDKEAIDKKYRQLLNIPLNKKVLLYCPTFRDGETLKYYDLDFERIIETLNKKFNTEWVVLVKLHPNIAEKADSFNYNEKVINASTISDITELEIFADLMITDYSSTMFDFAIMKKVCYIYANDYEEYIKQRDFNLSYDEMPFPISKTQEELENAIMNFEPKTYSADIDKYLDKLGLFRNPNSSQDIAKFIIEVIK